MQINIRRTGSAILVLVALGAAAWHFKPWLDEPLGKQAGTSILAPEAPIVMPTNGGRRSVATVTPNSIMISNRPNPITLTAEGVADLRRFVELAEPGKYTLRQLHGEDLWQHLRRRQAHGLGFKATATAGKLKGIRCAGKRSDKAQLYEVMPRAKEAAELRESAEAFA